MHRYNYYIWDNSHNTYQDDIDDVTVRYVIPEIFGSRHNFIWGLLSKMFNSHKSVFYMAQLIKDDKIVSNAQVVSWIPIFSFMPKSGLHIGPCVTIPQERGHGYYPYILSLIQKKENNRHLFMMVRSDNYSSIRGLSKAGFTLYAVGHKDYFGRYILDKYV